ncbi:DNA primase [Bacilli bacterium PM5-3]|nr:DNA primase [Bacilli bacterium PM5-3]
MKKIDDTTIEEIKNKNDIVDVLSNYISLTKKGKNYVSLCPFHNDTNPSMVISQEKQIYKCFSCGAGGDVVNFVKEYEKISFVDSLLKLASRAGIEIAVENTTNNISNDLKEYYKINSEVNNLYQYLLVEGHSDFALNYLHTRGIDDKLIEKFRLGYCSSNEVVSNLIKQKGYDDKKAVELGLLNIKGNELVDNYQNRIIYPIIDIYDNVLGFTCRALNNATPKYINSIESKIFNKSRILYNINNAKDSIKKNKSVYILEGPNDVIAFYKANIENAVCVMGTALTSEHISVLKTLGIKEIILGFDGDDAGKKATINAIKLLQKEKLSIKYLDFGSSDPDEFLNNHGFQKFTELVSQPKSAIEFKINYEFNQINTNNYQEKKNIVVKIVNDLNNILDEFDKEYYYNYLANLSGISFDLIKTFASKKQPVITKQVKLDKPKVTKRSDLENAAINALYYMMNDYKYYEIFNKEIGTFINAKYRRLYNVIAAYYLEMNTLNIIDIQEMDIDDELKLALKEIYLSYNYDIYNDKEIFLDSISTLKLEKYYLEIEKLQDELKNLADPIKKAELSIKILEINAIINKAKYNKFNK